MRLGVLAGWLALVMIGVQAQPQAGQQVAAQQAIPDAPRPQPSLPDLRGVAPGQGTTSSSNPEAPAETPTATPPSAPPVSAPVQPAATSAQAGDDSSQMVLAPSGQGVEEIKKIIVNVNAVEVAFTVKDSKGHLVPGLMPRDIQVYENGEPQAVRRFTGDAFPLSVALVVDQSMTQDEMDKVNNALGALPDAFTKYDEISVFTYNKGPKMVTDFTGAQSARLTQAIERSKGTGRQPPMAGSFGPLGQTTVLNDQNVDPNTAAVRGHTGMALETEREVHPLSDAILAAANALSTRPIERRRVIYVISDGKDFGSTAKMSQVEKILQMNNIEVDGTLVGDTAVWGLGTLDRMHLPLMMRDNVLTPYAIATGGNVDSEFRTPEIEKSFDKIAGEARYRYTLVYYSREPFVDGKYRKLEVKVLHPDLLVLAKPGYWPSAMAVRQRQPVSATP